MSPFFKKKQVSNIPEFCKLLPAILSSLTFLVTRLPGSAEFSGLAVMPKLKLGLPRAASMFIDAHVLMDGRKTVPSQHKNQGSGGIPGWLSSLVLHGACSSLCLCLCLPLSVLPVVFLFTSRARGNLPRLWNLNP